MKKKVDKIIALVIACIMVFSLMPRSMNHVIASTTETASMTDATEAVTVDADDSEIENVSPTEDKEKDTEDDISDDSDVNSDTEDGQEPEEDTEEDTEDETEEDVAFDSSVTCDGVVIRVTADEGVFPAGATLSAKRVSDSKAEAAGVADAVEEKRDNNVNVAASLTFDITVFDKDGNEIEPDTEKGEVKVSFSYPLIANKNLDTNVYHIKDEAGAPEAEKLNADEEGSIAEVTTDGFSFYTVEFTYGEKQYVMKGDTYIPLSDILSYVGLTGDVTAVSVSNASLFSASNGGNGWIVTARKAFSSIEWMKVTIDGIEYEIVVTDDSPQFSRDTSTRFSPQEKSDTYVAYYRRELGFDVQGAGGIQTTFADRGYKTELKVGDDQHQLSEFYFGDTYIYKGIKVRITPSLPSGSKGVVITYEIENTNLDKTTIKIGSWADVQIGSNDSAPIELKDNGLVMTGDGNTFTLVPGGGNFNTKWFGYYGGAEGNVFVNSNTYQGTNADSGIAWSWTLEIQPGARITKTAVLAAGDIQTYTLSFNANGGSGTMNPQTYVGGVSTALPPKAFTSNDTDKPDFMGWADTQERANAGTVDYYDEGNITLNSNKTLYAVWGRKQLQEVHITVPNINMTYGDIGVKVEATTDAAGGGGLSYEVVSGSDVISVNYTTGAITAKKYGDAEIKVTAAETPFYQKGEATATVHVFLKNIALKANDASKTYGSNDPSFTSIYTVTGSESLVSGDTISNSFTTSGGMGRNAGENVGTYSITGNGITSDKYKITSVTPGTFTINPKTLTITAAAKSKTYGASDPALTYTATGLANGDTTSVITGSLTRAPGEAVGTYAITKGDISAGNNYTVSYTDTGANLTINPKPITITSDGGEKVYDGTPLTKNGYTNTALAFDDDIKSVTFTGSQTVVGSSDNTVGTVVIKNGDQDVTANYNISYVNGTLKVTKKDLTITATDATKTYDSTALTSDAYEATELGDGDAIESVTFTGEQIDVGSSKNKPSDAVIMKGSVNVTDCYDITYVEGTLEVTKATITVTEGITAEGKQYDATTDATLDFSGAVLDGKCGNDDVSVTATGTFSDKNVGEDKTVNISDLKLIGDKAGNYKLATTGNQKTTTASITERVEVVQNDDGTTTTTTTTTDEDGNEVVTKETEKDGKVIEEKETHYDEDGNVTKETETTHNDDGTTTEKETVNNDDGTSTETVTEKDENGDVTKETVTEKDEDDKPTHITETEIERDENGDVTKETVTEKDGDGTVTKETETVTERDEDGNVTKETVTEKDGDGDVTKETETTHNEDGTTTEKEIVNNDDGTSTVTVTEKDKDDNVTKETVTEKDKDGHITEETETQYDEEGNVTQVTETTTSEDGKTRSVVVTDGEGNSINTYEEVVSPDSNAAKFVKKLGEAPDTTMDNSVNDLADMLLNDDEKVEMEAGERVSMYLTIEDISETVDSQDKAKIAAVVAGAGLTEYYDINLYKKIGTADEQKITETSSPINMTIQISDELINTDPNIERSYVLVRLHEGTAAVVPANINLASKTASFGSDRFSIYAIVCIDKTTGSKTDAKVEVSKKTDDSTPLFPIIFMFVMSAAGSVFVARKRSMIL